MVCHHPSTSTRFSTPVVSWSSYLTAAVRKGVVAAHPSVVKGGGVTLECDDGRLPVSRDVFALSSPLMADLLGEGSTSVKVSGSTKEEWLLVISQLYPIVPHPELSVPQLQQVLPVVHKAPEQLQLDALKEAALEGLKKQPDQRLRRQLATKAMHPDLLRLSPELMLEAWRVVAEAKICCACAQDCTCKETR
ncbi:hypothetical protein HaLaN_08675, partial [Haematococcus lacustris]